MIKRPNSRGNLDRAIERIFGNYEKSTEIRSIMANTIVGQMLPEGVVKGGSSLKLRFGNQCTRVTMDLDMACRGDLAAFLDALAANLKQGWNGFSGTIVRYEPASPKNIPAEYVMKPYGVKLLYNGQSWCTVDLEIGFNEIGDAEDVEYGLSGEVVDIFRQLAFPDPKPVPLMRLEYQIAQKLHGASEPGSRRAHDLIDLQLIVSRGEFDYRRLHDVCRRLFAYRRKQTWPPTVVKGVDWESVYNEENGKGSVLATVDEAIAWANELIAEIDGF